jgi:excisionase family DNA binding protein
MSAEFQNSASEAIAQVFQAFAALPTLIAVLQEQAEQISAVRAELKALQNNQHPASELPTGYISSQEYAARKFVSIKEAAFLLHLSTKSIRRLIERKILTSSKAVGVKRIPKEDIEKYKAATA